MPEPGCKFCFHEIFIRIICNLKTFMKLNTGSGYRSRAKERPKRGRFRLFSTEGQAQVKVWPGGKKVQGIHYIQ